MFKTEKKTNPAKSDIVTEEIQKIKKSKINNPKVKAKKSTGGLDYSKIFSSSGGIVGDTGQEEIIIGGKNKIERNSEKHKKYMQY